MKDTLIALNGKLQALTDNEKEVSNHREYLKTSEGKRDELHVHITELSQKIEVDTKAHDTKHTSNITEIQRLLAEIQSLKDQMNQRENEHLKSMEQVS